MKQHLKCYIELRVLFVHLKLVDINLLVTICRCYLFVWRKGRNKKSGRIFCVWLATSLIARKTAFLHHLWGKQNYQALFVFRPWTEFISFFFPILIILCSFSQNNPTTQIALAHSIFRTIEARASLAQQIIKNKNMIKRFYIENSPLGGSVQSGQSAIT